MFRNEQKCDVVAIIHGLNGISVLHSAAYEWLAVSVNKTELYNRRDVSKLVSNSN